MTRRPGELPSDLTKVAFTVEQGRERGLSRTRLRAADLDRPLYGVRRAVVAGPGEGEPDPRALLTARLQDQCSAAELVTPPRAFFSHLTAARLWPLPLPMPRPNEPVHVGVLPPEHPPRRAGVIGHHISDPAAHAVLRQGRWLIDPATLFCQLSPVLRLDDLVAVGDALVLTPRFGDPAGERPWLSLGELGERVDRFRGRGKTRAAQALALVRPGAESRPESLVRLALVAGGLPEPELNGDVHSERGVFLGRADMLYRAYRLIVEYDGDQHRVDAWQFNRDIRRLDGFAAHGWRVVRITADAFFTDRAGCLARVEQALITRGWRR